MTWILWVIAGWLIFGAIFSPILIGKEPKPYTAGRVITSSILNLGFAAAIIFIGIF